MEVKILDKNYAQTYTNTNGQLGQNKYYSIYTSQIEEQLSNSKGIDRKINLKEGDIISVVAKNNSLTLSQAKRNVYYTIVGDDLHIIVATGSGIVAINGAT